MPRWEPNARERLVEAALDLFERQGYEATSVAQIAGRAGLSKATFFRHFPDKREVLVAGQEAHCQLLFDATVGAPADASPLTAVGVGLRALSAAFPADRRQLVARIQTTIDGHSDLRERAALKRAGFLDALQSALRERNVPDTTTAVAAELAVLAFYTALSDWASEESATDLGELAEHRLLQATAAAAALGGSSDRTSARR